MATAIAFATSLLAFPAASPAQIVLNEILPNPAGNDVGTERLEIVNIGTTTINVTGWAIDDAATIDEVAVRCRIPEDFDTSVCPASASIAPGEFRVVKGQSTAAFLNNSGDDVYLISDRTLNPAVVDVVSYGDAAAHETEVWSCVPNGSENFAWRAQSLCGSNGGSGDFTPPAAIAGLTAAPGEFSGEIRLTWTASGDDGASGTASAYEIKLSASAIDGASFAGASDLDRWINEPLPLASGTLETLYVFGLDPGATYFFAIKSIDDAANVSGVSNSPGAAAQGGTPLDPDLGTSVYFGNLHSHTGYSDGAQTPTDAYAYARNSAQTPLDFLAVTDHNHSGAGMSLPNYATGLGEAAAANEDGAFVAIYGQEWGFASSGHVNIFEAPVLFGWEPGNHDVFVAEGDYASLYPAIAANPPATYAPIAHWCHPAPSDFDGLAVTPEGVNVVHLICLVNGPAFSTSTTESDVGNTGFDDVLQSALRAGYRVSPTADQDNHNANWGAASESRTAVHASAKSKAAILGALAARRAYATQDHNARVDISVDGHAMGEAWSSTAGVRIAVAVSDPDLSDSTAIIELFGGVTGQATAARIAWNEGSGAFAWRERGAFAEGDEAHYYLRVRQADNQTIWTGAVYVTYESATVVSGAPTTASVAGVRFDAPRPNPSPGAARLAFSLPRASGRVRLGVYDVQGRVIAELIDRAMLAGAHEAAWDGRTTAGVAAPPGVYFLRLDAAGAGTVVRKLTVVR